MQADLLVAQWSYLHPTLPPTLIQSRLLYIRATLVTRKSSPHRLPPQEGGPSHVAYSRRGLTICTHPQAPTTSAVDRLPS